VLRWLREKRRRVIVQTKAKKQSYFRNVFREATDVKSDIDSGDNENDAADDVDRPQVSKRNKWEVDKNNVHSNL